MTQYLRRIALPFLVAFVSMNGLAREEQTSTTGSVVVSSGLEGGGYWLAGNRLKAAGVDADLVVENVASTGSLNNLKALMDPENPVNVAFAQADALQFYLQEKPDEARSIETLRSIGEECVFIISGRKSGIRDLTDIESAKRFQLGIKSPNSGIRVTFDHMATLIPELKSVTVRYGDSVKMINDWVHHLSDIRKAVMVVHAPNAHSAEIDMVIANPEKYRFVQIKDKRLTQPDASAAVVYTAKRVAPGAVTGADKVPTICVEGLLLANKRKLPDTLKNQLSSLSDAQWQQIQTGD